MNFAVVYIFERALYRLAEFWRHWYVESFYVVSKIVVDILERFDRFFAVRINFRYLFQPLYQDYTVIGRILGFIFRSLRIATGSFLYALIVIVAAVFYFVWILLPPFIIYQALRGVR